MVVISWAVNINYVKIALKGRHVTIAIKLDVGIVVYLSSVITGTVTKLFACCVLALGIAGVVSAMVADRNFVLLTVDDTYLNSAKKGMKVFV